MSIRTSRWPAGVPCWADLTVPDVQVAKAFYADVLGWTFSDTGEEYGGYLFAESTGVATAGIGPAQPGTSVAWTVYVATDDADKSAAAVTENGGTVIVAPGDVGPLGRMFIAADPTGATFGVWQAGTHIGAGLVNQPGGLSWEDLRSSDPDTARTFYSAVFGYRTEPLSAAGPDYHTFSLPDDEAPLGGMGAMMGTDGPSQWIVYFGVKDAARAVAVAEKAGGSVVQAAFDTPYGKMAGLKDPAGGSFWIVENTDDDPAGRAG